MGNLDIIDITDSGVRFNIISDPIVSDIDRVNKRVDDVLGQLHTVQDAYDKLVLVLTRIIRLGMAVSTSKF